MMMDGIFRVSCLLQTLYRLFSGFFYTHHEIRDRATHLALYEDLMNHIWIHAENNPITNPENNPI
jgi:hypothetical protein